MNNRQFAVIGYPLGHTMSPPIHRRLFEMSGREASYTVEEIQPDVFDVRLTQLKKELDGFNITIPHKLRVMAQMDVLDETAQRYGAVNCASWCDGVWTGYNTDVVGFTRAVESMGASLSSRVLLLGCGGAGRMMAIETALRGGALTIATREKDAPRVQACLEDIRRLSPGAQVDTVLLDAVEGSYDLILNATPAGMYPHTSDAPIGEETVRRGKYLFDAVYNPSQTRLMQMAEKNGLTVLGGMSMLVWQAVAAHEIWDGASYEPGDIAAVVDEMQVLLDRTSLE